MLALARPAGPLRVWTVGFVNCAARRTGHGRRTRVRFRDRRRCGRKLETGQAGM